MKMVKTLPSLAFVALLAACGGGGGGSSPAPSTTPTVGPSSAPSSTPTPGTPTSAPTTAASSATVTGKAVELVSGAPLAGFRVTVGSVPNSGTCIAVQSSTLQPCGVPAGTTTTTTTAADGSFSMTIPAGTSMISIGKDSTYATLHRTVSSSSPALGTVTIAALSADEQAWLMDINNLRATLATPTSYANMIVDEYAEEESRQYATDLSSGKVATGDGPALPYAMAYATKPGALYQAGIVGVGNYLVSPTAVTYGSGSTTITDPIGTPGYILSDDVWMYEKALCPPGLWTNCPGGGHYSDLSSTNDVWFGLGEAPAPYSTQPNPQDIYNIFVIAN